MEKRNNNPIKDDKDSLNERELIMEDVLSLLNLKQSYKERKSDISKYINKQNTNYQILHLTVASTTLNYNQKIFSILPSGMLHNNNNCYNDGIVLFGYENYENETIDKVNDFVFPTVNNLEKSKNGFEFPNFAIYFDIKDENYYIKNLNTGMGALMKIKKYKLENNTLINIGSNYIVIRLDTEYLTLKIFNNLILENGNNEENCSSQKFKIEKNKNFMITIGRSQKCDISIGDMMLSKVQCSIEYNTKENLFYLHDGNEEKESTNGTWIYIVNPVQITNDFLFKAEHTLFIGNLTKNL